MVNGMVAPINWELYTPEGTEQLKGGDVIVWNKFGMFTIDGKYVLFMYRY